MRLIANWPLLSKRVNSLSPTVPGWCLGQVGGLFEAPAWVFFSTKSDVCLFLFQGRIVCRSLYLLFFSLGKGQFLGLPW